MASIAQLEALFAHLAEVQAPPIGDLPEGTDSADWFRAQGFVISRATMTGNVVGLTSAGLGAWLDFVNAVRRSDPRYARGTDFQPFAEAVFTEVANVRRGRAADPVQAAEIATIEAGTAKWFASKAQPQKHAIPCAILPDVATPFSVGPVQFQHVSTFNSAAFGIPPSLEQITLEPLQTVIKQRYADWLAIVDVDGCEPQRSIEIAELAVDIALAALQLVTPLHYSARASRITARMRPSFTVALVNTAGCITPRISNEQPGLGLSGAVFNAWVKDGSSVLASAGKRIRSFVSSGGALPKLEMAWCNGAFWFHEALAEPLATVSIAKLETAIENLFGSSNLGESKSRILLALKGLHGVERDDPIFPGSLIKVNSYVAKIVEVRSRILHGNWSTLTEELPISRSEVANLAIDLLTNYATKIEAYISTPSPADDVVQFLNWIVAQRQMRAPNVGSSVPVVP